MPQGCWGGGEIDGENVQHFGYFWSRMGISRAPTTEVLALIVTVHGAPKRQNLSPIGESKLNMGGDSLPLGADYEWGGRHSG